MPWVETSSPPFVVRHASGEHEGARRTLAMLEGASERVDAVLGVELGEVTAILHESELLLALAHPVLPVVRRLTAPAARRYLAGWAAASTVDGSPNSKASPTSVAVRSPTSTWPGAAACSSLAATFTASPVANELPSRGRPTTTSPEFTPIRNARRSPRLPQALEHPERGLQCTLGVVLLGGRRAEDRDDGVADELLDRPAAERDLGLHGVVELLQGIARVLGIELVAERGGPTRSANRSVANFRSIARG